jgi:hypothetical protein
MKFFRKIKNFLNHLTRDQDVVESKVSEVPQEPTPIKQEEETNLDINIENECLNQVRGWAIKKIELLHEADRHRNAKALQAEFEEWINIPEGVEEIDYFSIEKDDDEWSENETVGSV